MTNLFKDGFESGNFNNWSQLGSLSIVQWQPTAINTTHGGSYAAQATGSSSFWYKDLGNDIDHLFFSGYIKIPTMLQNNQKTYFLEILDFSGAYWVAGGLWVDNGNTKWILVVNSNNNVVEYFNEDAPIQTDKWYLLEIEYDKITNTANLWLEGTQVCHATQWTLANPARKVYAGNPSGITPAGFISYGDDYAVNSSENNPEDIDNVAVLNLLKIKTYQNDGYLTLRNVVSPSSAPTLEIDQGIKIKKDATVYGFVGTYTNPESPTQSGGGAIMMGHGFEYYLDPPRINMTDSGYTELCITAGATYDYQTHQYIGVNPVLADVKLRYLTGTTVKANDYYSKTGGEDAIFHGTTTRVVLPSTAPGTPVTGEMWFVSR
jgi:hypothetical protein